MGEGEAGGAKPRAQALRIETATPNVLQNEAVLLRR